MKILQSLFSKTILSFLLGAALSFSFAPFFQWWVAPLSLSLWIALFYQEAPRRAMLLGWIYGFGVFSFGLWWIRISLFEYGKAPLAFAIIATLLLAAYLSIYYSLLAWLASRITVRSKWGLAYRYGFLFPILGVILEVIRAHLLTGFPWLALGYTLTDTVFSQFVFTTMGALLGSFWVYWLGGLLFLCGYVVNKRKKSLLNLLITPIGLGGVIALLVYASTLFWSETIRNYGNPVVVTLVQGNIDQNEKFSQAGLENTLDTYLGNTYKNLEHSDIILWPETAFPLSYHPNLELLGGIQLSILNEWSVNTNTDIIAGIFGGDPDSDESMNTLVHFGKTPAENQFYNKHRLVPFGEYIPLRKVFDLFNRWVEIPYGDLARGEKHQPPFLFTSTTAKGSGSICFEAVFGDELRYQAKQSEFLINVSNDAWFGDSNGPWQHLQITRARSIELARPLIRATNNGITAIINPDGTISAKAPQFSERVLTGTIQPTIGLTAYAQLGDYTWLTVFLLMLGAVLLWLVPTRWAVARIKNTTAK